MQFYNTIYLNTSVHDFIHTWYYQPFPIKAIDSCLKYQGVKQKYYSSEFFDRTYM